MKSEVSSASTRRSEMANSRSKASGSKKVRRKEEIKPSSSEDGNVDAARLQVLLENLEIRFIECTFTYKPSHLQSQDALKKRPSKLTSLVNKISNTLERVREAVTFENTFNNCLFVPINEDEKIKNFIHGNFSDAKLSFVNCKFTKRSSTTMEQIARKLRKIFGIMFDLEYITSTATINRYTFRVKDIGLVNEHIQGRIVEES